MTDLYPVRVTHDVMIPMRDGVHLAANLYLPDLPEPRPLPAIVQYTPYLKDGRGGRGPIETGQMYFAARGYACLNLDMRGFGCSEGIPQPPFSASEKQDGFDALAWIASQPWCDGQTALWGISYGGDTALSVASLQPESLKAIVPIHAIDDEFTGVCYPRGCRGGHIGEIDWGFRMVGYQLLPPLRMDSARQRERLWLDRLDQIEPTLFAWHTIPPATWAGWIADIEAIRAPAYAVSAWHDCYPTETLRYFNQLNVPKRALIGPWKHEYPDRGTHFPIGFWAEMTRWWDHWMKGQDTGLMTSPPVIVFDQPNGGWRYEPAWPSPAAALQEFALDDERTLTPAEAAPALSSADVYAVDPTVGLNHLPWDWTTPTPATPADISPDDYRALAYTTRPLVQATHLLGQPEFIVHFSADQPDFPLTAWLSDVAPNGASTLICQGWIRPSHVAGERLQPGKVYDLTIPLNPTSYLLPAGHRLRLCLAGSSFPALIPAPVNPTLVVFIGGPSGSRLRLPVAASDARLTETPVFLPALNENPPAFVSSDGRYGLNRDLLDGWAAYEFDQTAEYQLDEGVKLTTEMHGQARIDRANPRNIELTGTQRTLVERPGEDDVIVTAQVRETFDTIELKAQVASGSRQIFAREWAADLRQAGWAYPAD